MPRACGPRNDMVIGGWSFCFDGSIIGAWSAGWCSAQRIKNPLIAGGNHTLIQMPPALQYYAFQCRERASTVPRYIAGQPPHFRRNGTGPRPAKRIPYAERILATGRAVQLAFRLARSTSHEFVSGHCPQASPARPRRPRRSGNLSPYLRCFCGQIPPPIGRLRGRRGHAELRRW